MAEADSGPQNDAADPMVGKVLSERFSIIAVIGTGGMGRVYKAIQAPLDRICAVKVLNPVYGGGRDPNFQRRFFLEASLTAKLRHPNTITVIDYGRTDDGIFYIAMEYVEGQTLAQILSANGALSVRRALHITQQICRSLREAHKLGIIHRDLKPANVMLLTEETDHDMVKVLDFGLVKPLEGGTEPEITQAGMMLGSPLYMAPEQARHTADVRSDIYSLGVVLYQMLMGRPPFQARESVDAIVKHISQRPPPFAQVRPDLSIPQEVEAVVMRCLQKEPELRFQTMDELLEGIRLAAHASGASGIFTDPRSSLVASAPHSSPRRTISDAGLSPSGSVAITLDEPASKKRLLMAGVFAVSLVAGGAGMWWATRTSDDAAATAPPLSERVATPTGEPGAGQKPPERAGSAAQVAFEVTSQPVGARVYLGDRDLGTAPVRFEVPPGSDGIAEATLTLTMDGYQPVTVTARGKGPSVALSQPLKKKVRKPARTTPRQEEDPSYKDDPYKDDPYQ